MTKNYFVAYDLNVEGQDYKKIQKAIESCGFSIRIQKSLFYLKSAATLEEISKVIKAAVDKTDRLIVIEASNAFTLNLFPGTEEQIMQRWIQR